MTIIGKNGRIGRPKKKIKRNDCNGLKDANYSGGGRLRIVFCANGVQMKKALRENIP